MDKIKDIDSKSRSYILQGFRKSFAFSDKHKECLKAARVEKVKLNKDGTPSKKPDVFYKCNECKYLFKQKEIHVDHIKPVIRTNEKLIDLSWAIYQVRLFFTKVQALCKPCHKEKTRRETKERTRNRKK